MIEYVVLMPRIEGNPDVGFEEMYYTDNRRFAALGACIRHGVKDLAQSDDFLIAVLDGDELVRVQYMGEVPTDPDYYVDRDRVAYQLCWKVKP